MDFDYADPTPLMHDMDSANAKDDEEDNLDMDSGYQEPQEILSSAHRVNATSSSSSAAVLHSLYNPHNGQFTPVTEVGSGQRRKHRHNNNKHHGSRPVVSSPTRIENPNVLPPLNLYPGQSSNTVGRFQATTATIGGRGKNKYVTVNAQNGAMTASLNRRMVNEFTASGKCANI